MKKFLLMFVFSTLSIQAQSIKVLFSQKETISQQRLEAMPSDIRNAILAEIKVPKLFTLEICGGVSLYQKDGSTKNFNYENSETSKTSESSVFESKIIVNKKSTPFFYYKELNNDLMLFKLTNGGIEFNGKDKLISWNWEITNETKVINGYNCKKATSKTFNEYYIAWFTEDIPVNAGPEKFDGLPGLIIYINTGYLEFIAEKIEVSNQIISIAKPKIPETTVTFSEMIDIVTKKFNKVKTSKPIKQGNTTITTETY